MATWGDMFGPKRKGNPNQPANFETKGGGKVPAAEMERMRALMDQQMAAMNAQALEAMNRPSRIYDTMQNQQAQGSVYGDIYSNALGARAQGWMGRAIGMNELYTGPRPVGPLHGRHSAGSGSYQFVVDAQTGRPVPQPGQGPAERAALEDRVRQLTGEEMTWNESRGCFLLAHHYVEMKRFETATDSEIVDGVAVLLEAARAYEASAAERKREYEEMQAKAFRDEKRKESLDLLVEHDSLAMRLADSSPIYLVFDQPLDIERATDLHMKDALLDHLRVLRSQQVQNAARAALADMRDEIRAEIVRDLGLELGETRSGKIKL